MLKCNTKLEILADQCFGHGASVVANVIIAIAVLGIVTMYLILFANVAIMLLVPSGKEEYTENDLKVQNSFLNSKYFYCIALSLGIAPIVIKKSIASLKWNSYVIYGGVACLTLVLA